jgi:hypothetical protein
LLEEADGGDAGCAGLCTGAGILQSNSSKGEDGDWGAAGFAESVEAGGFDCGGVFFFEDWGEDCEGGLVCGGCGDFLWGVTGDGDERNWW